MSRILSWTITLVAVAAGLGLIGAPSPAEAVATQAPNTPTNLAAAVDAAIPWYINVSWTDNTPATSPDNETSFEIQRCTGAGCTDFTTYLNYPTPGFDLERFVDNRDNPDNTTFSYRIRGVNAAGASDWSTVATATTGWRPPAAPANLTAAYVGADTRGLNGNTLLTWTDQATTEFGYRVTRCEPINCVATRSVVTLPVNSTSFLDTSVVDGAEYWYVVTAVGGSGFDGFSPRITHVAGPGLAAPTRVAASTTRGGVRLTWRNQVRQPVRIWRCDTNVCVDAGTGEYLQSLFTEKTTVAAGTTSWTDRFTPVAGTRYFYRLQVVTPSAVSRPVYVAFTG